MCVTHTLCLAFAYISGKILIEEIEAFWKLSQQRDQISHKFPAMLIVKEAKSHLHYSMLYKTFALYPQNIYLKLHLKKKYESIKKSDLLKGKGTMSCPTSHSSAEFLLLTSSSPIYPVTIRVQQVGTSRDGGQ